MASILFNEQPKKENKSSLTPGQIMIELFHYRNVAHKFHLNSMVIGEGSYAQHKALDGLYKGIQKLQDDILEQLMGYLGSPINEPSESILSAPSYEDTSQAKALCDTINNFAKRLQKYANDSDYPNIENLAQELSGLAAHTKYFLMFK